MSSYESKNSEDRHFYCPYTRNKKFEVFIDDLFDIGFETDRIKKEIKSYV